MEISRQVLIGGWKKKNDYSISQQQNNKYNNEEDDDELKVDVPAGKGGDEFAAAKAAGDETSPVPPPPPPPPPPHQPQTPKEPMDFLSRSWSLTASEISKALLAKQSHHPLPLPLPLPEEEAPLLIPPPPPPQHHQHYFASAHQIAYNTVEQRLPAPPPPGAAGAIGRWFHHKQHKQQQQQQQQKQQYSSSTSRKDKARIENARIHAALSIASLAAGLASVAAAAAAAPPAESETCKKNSSSITSNSKMNMAFASATQLLASHCIELAESAGADHQRVSSLVRSALDIRTSSDLLTLTAAAATALRGEAALKSRLPKEANKRNNAAITPSPCDKSMIEPHPAPAFHEHPTPPPCIGDLLQHTYKGVLRWKHVSVYINKETQVIMKLKSKHVGGAFSKKNKCVVYEVCNEIATWSLRQENEKENWEAYFGVKTARGVMEFKCKNKIHKQKWADGIQNLLSRTSGTQEAQQSFEFLSCNKSI